MKRSFLGRKEGASLVKEPAHAKERRLVVQARVWHGGGEAEPDRGIPIPTWVTPGLRHEGVSAVLGGRKEVGMDMTFTERDCLSSRGQSMWLPGSVWFSEWASVHPGHTG